MNYAVIIMIIMNEQVDQNSDMNFLNQRFTRNVSIFYFNLYYGIEVDPDV